MELSIAGRRVGPGHPTYVIAEISANHGGELERAEALVRAAAAAGADAAKLQTYTPDGMTLDLAEGAFRVSKGTLWEGRTLYSLYEEAQTPWEWHPRLLDLASELGIHLFSAPFDASAVEFLDELDVPALKIASFELVDLDLIRAAAATARPLIMSTGMAELAEIDEAVAVAREADVRGLALLRCNSAYPAPVSEMDLRTIPDMVQRWGVPIGLSDHTLGTAAATVAVALGASLIEKHITLSRADPTPDAAFSLEPAEFGTLVSAVREVEALLGSVRYGSSDREKASLAFRRSLYVVEDIAAGETVSERNVRSIRPAGGLSPRELPRVLGSRARRPLVRGTALTWDDLIRP